MMKQVSAPSEKSGLVLNISTNTQESHKHPYELTDIIGKSGWWQIKILLFTLITSIPTSWNHLAMGFLAYPVDHWCQRYEDVSVGIWWTDFLPNTTLKGKLQHSQCEMFETIGSSITSKTVYCDSYEYASDFNSIVNKWDLVCRREWMVSTSQTVYMIGFLLAVMLSGQFSDMYGRHPTIMINIVILLVAGFATAFSTSITMFIVCRFFVAIGHGGLGLVIYIILVEAIGSEYRVLYMLLQGIGWIIGFLVLPLIAWLTRDWFLLQLIITVPSILFLSYYWLLTESPRWLLANGYKEKAIPILEIAAKTNGKPIKDLEAKVDLLLLTLNTEGEKYNSKTTVLDLLRTPNLRMKTLSLYFLWAVIAFTYYGLSLNTNDLAGNAFFNFFLSGLMEIPATLFCLLTLDRFGRKKSFFFTLMVSGVACCGCIFVPERFSGVKTTFAMIGKLFNSASFTIVYIFSAETFPTVARNVGVGSSSTIARIGSAISPFMKDLSNATNPSVPLGIFGVLSIISALIVLKMPETGKHPIPESIVQAEEFGQKQKPESVIVNAKIESS